MILTQEEQNTFEDVSQRIEMLNSGDIEIKNKYYTFVLWFNGELHRYTLKKYNKIWELCSN